MKNKKIEQIEFVCSLQGVDINIADNSLKTPLFYAIATGSLEIVRYICNIQNVNYNVINLAIFAFLYFFGVFFLPFCLLMRLHSALHRKEKKVLLKWQKSFNY